MGKQGPCCHCGVTSTPLWRNGPPEKPVLCNACGSRWRTKGTLVNYTPLHARSEPDEFEDQHFNQLKTISVKNKDVKLLKRKKNYEITKGFDEDTSNRSSSGSAISNSDSCMQLCSADASDLIGPAQSSVVWDTTVPSRKRTCVNRPKQSPVEKLTKDLYTILHEQRSYFSGSSEEDLIFESDTPMVSVEIGHGSVLIRHPNSMAREEESEASSLSFETKNEAYSRLDNKVGNFSSRGCEKSKTPLDHDQMNRDNDEKSPILVNHKSPLCQIDLKGVINFDEFTSQMTNDEQKHLLKYLPLVDTVNLPDSLKSMFDSPQFKESLSSFQKLLADGVFDLSLPVIKNENFRTLKNLALHNVTKSKWVEQYDLIQDSKRKYDRGGCLVAGVCKNVAPDRFVSVKKSLDAQFHSFQGSKNTMKSPKRSLMKASYEYKELMDNDATGFSPRSLFALPPDNSALLLDSLRYTDEFSDQDLLLDVPSHTSFPEAELLCPSTISGTSVYRH